MYKPGTNVADMRKIVGLDCLFFFIHHENILIYIGQNLVNNMGQSA